MHCFPLQWWKQQPVVKLACSHILKYTWTLESSSAISYVCSWMLYTVRIYNTIKICTIYSVVSICTEQYAAELLSLEDAVTHHTTSAKTGTYLIFCIMVGFQQIRKGLKVLLSICFNLLFIWEYYSRSYNYGMWHYIIRLMFCFYEMMKIRCVPFRCTEGISI